MGNECCTSRGGSIEPLERYFKVPLSTLCTFEAAMLKLPGPSEAHPFHIMIDASTDNATTNQHPSLRRPPPQSQHHTVPLIVLSICSRLRRVGLTVPCTAQHFIATQQWVDRIQQGLTHTFVTDKRQWKEWRRAVKEKLSKKGSSQPTQMIDQLLTASLPPNPIDKVLEVSNANGLQCCALLAAFLRDLPAPLISPVMTTELERALSSQAPGQHEGIMRSPLAAFASLWNTTFAGSYPTEYATMEAVAEVLFQLAARHHQHAAAPGSVPPTRLLDQAVENDIWRGTVEAFTRNAEWIRSFAHGTTRPNRAPESTRATEDLLYGAIADAVFCVKNRTPVGRGGDAAESSRRRDAATRDGSGNGANQGSSDGGGGNQPTTTNGSGAGNASSDVSGGTGASSREPYSDKQLAIRDADAAAARSGNPAAAAAAAAAAAQVNTSPVSPRAGATRVSGGEEEQQQPAESSSASSSSSSASDNDDDEDPARRSGSAAQRQHDAAGSRGTSVSAGHAGSGSFARSSGGSPLVLDEGPSAAAAAGSGREDDDAAVYSDEGRSSLHQHHHHVSHGARSRQSSVALSALSATPRHHDLHPLPGHPLLQTTQELDEADDTIQGSSTTGGGGAGALERTSKKKKKPLATGPSAAHKLELAKAAFSRGLDKSITPAPAAGAAVTQPSTSQQMLPGPEHTAHEQRVVTTATIDTSRTTTIEARVHESSSMQLRHNNNNNNNNTTTTSASHIDDPSLEADEEGYSPREPSSLTALTAIAAGTAESDSAKQRRYEQFMVEASEIITALQRGATESKHQLRRCSTLVEDALPHRGFRERTQQTLEELATHGAEIGDEVLSLKKQVAQLQQQLDVSNKDRDCLAAEAAAARFSASEVILKFVDMERALLHHQQSLRYLERKVLDADDEMTKADSTHRTLRVDVDALQRRVLCLRDHVV